MSADRAGSSRRRWLLLVPVVLGGLVAAWCLARDGSGPESSDRLWTWRGQLRDPEPLSDLPPGTRCVIAAIPQPAGLATAELRCGALALQRIPCPCRLTDASGAPGTTPRLTCNCERIFRCDTRAGHCDLDASRLGFALHVSVHPTPTLEPPGAVARPRGLAGDPDHGATR